VRLRVVVRGDWVFVAVVVTAELVVADLYPVDEVDVVELRGPGSLVVCPERVVTVVGSGFGGIVVSFLYAVVLSGRRVVVFSRV
jgi:hypothetical protein